MGRGRFTEEQIIDALIRPSAASLQRRTPPTSAFQRSCVALRRNYPTVRKPYVRGPQSWTRHLWRDALFMSAKNRGGCKNRGNSLAIIT